MENEWILDVIADLRTFARHNGLDELASQLDTAWMLAACEIASASKGMAQHERSRATAVGSYSEIRGKRL